jgi:D-3-phosphoglycerate dehydrogenase
MLGRGATPKLIETSFYGELAPFADWLLVPVVAGIWDDFDRSLDFQAARAFLKEMGISYVNREVDNLKGYGSSITVDMTADTSTGGLRNVSIRGTVAEGILMVARIDEFHKLYFEPVGPTAFFLYDDRPGVLGTIGSKLAESGINIEDVRNPHDRKTNRSLAIMKVNTAVSGDLANEIGKAIDAHAAFSIVL